MGCQQSHGCKCQGSTALLRKREETGRRPRKDVRCKDNNWTRKMDALEDGEGDGA